MNASVKVMNSYDYCHFEIQLSREDISLNQVDDLRKEAQRLVDKAIKQYKTAKRVAAATEQIVSADLERRVRAIKENYPQSEWTPEQRAAVKELEDQYFRASRSYDYQDDWEDEGEY